MFYVELFYNYFKQLSRILFYLIRIDRLNKVDNNEKDSFDIERICLLLCAEDRHPPL